MKTWWRTCSGIFLGGVVGRGRNWRRIQGNMGYPSWSYNWSLPYKLPHLSGKIDSGKVDLQAILKSHLMVVHINLCQEFLAVFCLYLSPVTASVWLDDIIQCSSQPHFDLHNKMACFMLWEIKRVNKKKSYHKRYKSIRFCIYLDFLVFL